MDIINAIAKVRFSSARPQRVQLSKGPHGAGSVELLCLEPGQEVRAADGQWAYYVIAGSAQITSADRAAALPTSQMAATNSDEAHTLANTAETRLICLAIRSAT